MQHRIISEETCTFHLGCDEKCRAESVGITAGKTVVCAASRPSAAKGALTRSPASDGGGKEAAGTQWQPGAAVGQADLGHSGP